MLNVLILVGRWPLQRTRVHLYKHFLRLNETPISILWRGLKKADLTEKCFTSWIVNLIWLVSRVETNMFHVCFGYSVVALLHDWEISCLMLTFAAGTIITAFWVLLHNIVSAACIITISTKTRIMSNISLFIFHSQVNKSFKAFRCSVLKYACFWG